MVAAIDWSNTKFFKLTHVKRVGRDGNRGLLQLWQCECGNTREARGTDVRDGTITACRNCSYKKFQGEESVLAAIFRNHKGLDKTGYSDGDLTFDQFRIMCKQLCYWCNRWKPSTRIGTKGIIVEYHGLDRLDSTRGHFLDNVVPCCWTCNNMFGNMPAHEREEWIKMVYDNKGNRK